MQLIEYVSAGAIIKEFALLPVNNNLESCHFLSTEVKTVPISPLPRFTSERLTSGI